MNEMNILFSLEKQEDKYKEIEISVENKLEDNLDYKFLIGIEGTWTTIKQLSEDSDAIWKPLLDGNYSIMVQAKRKNSIKPFDFMSKTDYIIGDITEKQNSDINIDKVQIMNFRCLTQDLLQDVELVFEVEAKHEDNRMVLYKFIKINDEGICVCLKDYSTKKLISYIEENKGEYKLLCLAKDMYSLKEFDDRAIIHYSVKPYDEINIQSFTSDLSSPQSFDTPIIFKCITRGGKELLYKFKINGNSIEDSGYTINNNYTWTPKEAGKYKVSLWVKDVSYTGEYEKESCFNFIIDDMGNGNVIIEDIIIEKRDIVLIGETVNIKVNATGGTSLRYSFAISRDDTEIDKMEFGIHDFVNFTPEEKGKFKLEIRVKDKYSRKEFDAKAQVYIQALECIPAKIEYVLMDTRKYFMVGDTISLQVICENTRDCLVNYVLKIDGHSVEETGFVEHKNYEIKPNCSGTYVIELLAKNKKSTSGYDSKKEIKIEVHDSLPITDTKILCDKADFIVNETIAFEVQSNGGTEVVYEFYLMEKTQWSLVQKFSKKDDYIFMPFDKGIYRLLVLAKSFYKSFSYEDYDILEIEIKE